MLKHVLLTVLLAGALAVPARAQTTSLLPKSPPGPVYTHNDTIRAIQHLYERRRKGGRRWLYGAGAGVLVLVRTLISANSAPTSYPGYTTYTTSSVDGGQVAAVAGIFVGLPAAIGASKLIRFNDKHETDAINNYVATHRPPHGFGRRLHRKDFR